MWVCIRNTVNNDIVIITILIKFHALRRQWLWPTSTYPYSEHMPASATVVFLIISQAGKMYQAIFPFVYLYSFSPVLFQLLLYRSMFCCFLSHHTYSQRTWTVSSDILCDWSFVGAHVLAELLVAWLAQASSATLGLVIVLGCVTAKCWMCDSSRTLLDRDIKQLSLWLSPIKFRDING